MKLIKSKIILPEGNFITDLLSYNKDDKKILFTVYIKWRKLCNSLKSIYSRETNLPEGISETAFCIEMGTYRMIKKIN